jgi:transcriptional regulator with GAF, ATPase, and Fis domain
VRSGWHCAGELRSIPPRVDREAKNWKLAKSCNDRIQILETLEQINWLIGGQYGAANRLGLPRTTLIYRCESLESKYAGARAWRPIRQLADEQCRAVANY